MHQKKAKIKNMSPAAKKQQTDYESSGDALSVFSEDIKNQKGSTMIQNFLENGNPKLSKNSNRLSSHRLSQQVTPSKD